MKTCGLCISIAGALLVSAITQADSATAPATGPASRSATAPTGPLSYRLAEDNERWPIDKRQRIVASMASAVALYNELGSFPKAVTANYNPGTPTADANYNGWINFGGSINTRVALHEIAHTLGVGQHRNWQQLIKDGKWTGEHALAQVREFDGPDAILHADRQHFWPYGLNYDKESSPVHDRRHVLMVAALRKDMGITDNP